MKRMISFFLAVVMLLGMMPTVMAASPFSDVPADAYYYDAVLWAVEKNITTGTGGDKFSPLMNCTRSQVVTFLWRAAGSPEPTATEMDFSDVPADAYYYDAVLWAVEKNITTGTGSGKFSPLMDCSRAQIVTFLWRSQGSPAVSGVENPFKDVPAGQYYTDAVLWAVSAGITTGTAADKFSPDMICTRSQIVTFLYRCMGNSAAGSIVITQQPVDPVGVTGDTVSVSVKAEGGKGALSYLWQYSYDGTTFYNAPLGTYFKNYDTDTMSFTIEPNDFILYDGWYYRCVITDENGNKVTSDIVQLIDASTLPQITTQPQAAATGVGMEAVFSVTVSGGEAPYGYEWQVKLPGMRVYQKAANVEALSANGADKSKLTINPGTIELSGALFRCEVTDANGTTVISDAAKLTVRENTLKIVTQPQVQRANPGTTVTYTVEVSGGTEPYTYQWQQIQGTHSVDITGKWSNGVEKYSGYGTASLSVKVDAFDHAYSRGYRCVITDAYGLVITSDTAELLPPLPLSLSISHQDYWTSGADLGHNQHRLIAKASNGSGEYTYNWYKKVVPVGSDADDYSFNATSDTGDTVTFTNTNSGKYLIYKCVVTDKNNATAEATVWIQYESHL